MITTPLPKSNLNLVRDVFLFSAFTGLSFSDMRNLREENIRTYFDNHEWININRQKTGVESNIRLLDLPRRIIEKYRGLCEDGRIFPVPHYMTCLCGIRAVARGRKDIPCPPLHDLPVWNTCRSQTVRYHETPYMAPEPPHGGDNGIPVKRRTY